MAKERFQCATDSGLDLCFIGGSCANLTLPSGFVREVCLCPSGFGRDYVLFHSDNCALPDYALLALFVTNLVLSFGYLILLFRARFNAKENALRVLHLAILFVVLFCFELLALYLENGWFGATSAMVSLVIFAICAWGAQLGQLVALPIFGMNKDIQFKVQRFIKLSFILFGVVNLAGCIAMAVTAYEEDLAPYNRAVMFFGLSQFITVLCFGIIIISYGNQLERLVDQADLAKKKALSEKLGMMRRGTIAIVSAQFAGVGGVIVFWILGSVPFHWVIMFPTFLSMPLSVTVTTLGIFRSNRSILNSERPRSSKLALGLHTTTAS